MPKALSYLAYNKKVSEAGKSAQLQARLVVQLILYSDMEFLKFQ